MGRIKLPNTPSIRRMSTYLPPLIRMRESGAEFASTTTLADCMKFDPLIVRKDVALTGVSGQRGVGYRTSELIDAIRRYLGWQAPCPACLVGAGSLGSALLGYEALAEYGIRIRAVFDADPAKTGTTVRGFRVSGTANMADEVRKLRPELAILCVPSGSAQAVADVLIGAGVRAFWNFANVTLKTPDDVLVQPEAIAGGFALLSVKLHHGGCTPKPW